MTSHRLSLTLILLAVAAAGVIVGYALAGFDEASPLMIAVTVTSAPEPSATAPLPTWTPTPLSMVSELPRCDVAPRHSLCLTTLVEYSVCPTQGLGAIPCYKP